MSFVASSHPGSRFIGRLPKTEQGSLLARCRYVQLRESQVLYEAGGRIAHVYFPTDSYVSLITPVPGHHDLEVGMVGSEGVVGALAGLGAVVSPLLALVQGEGASWRTTAAAFRAEVRSSRVLHRHLGGYLSTLVAQLTRSAGCNRFHLLDGRLARWLLMTHDRARSPRLHLTHEFMASVLGVRRAGLTQAALRLQDGGLIAYRRGEVTILDRAGLEAAACGCYRLDKDSLDALDAQR